MSEIYFKFRNARDTKKVAFTGAFLSVSELKRLIAQQTGIGGDSSAGLEITDPQTGATYKDDSQQVPRNSSVVVRRVLGGGSAAPARAVKAEPEPAAEEEQPDEQPGPHAEDDFGGDVFAAPDQEEDAETKALKARLLGVAASWEQEKGRAAQAGQHAYKSSRKEREGPPRSYICPVCSKVGEHMEEDCPLRQDPSVRRVRRPVGIPMTELVRDTEGGMVFNDKIVVGIREDRAVFDEEEERRAKELARKEAEARAKRGEGPKAIQPARRDERARGGAGHGERQQRAAPQAPPPRPRPPGPSPSSDPMHTYNQPRGYGPPMAMMGAPPPAHAPPPPPPRRTQAAPPGPSAPPGVNPQAWQRLLSERRMYEEAVRSYPSSVRKMLPRGEGAMLFHCFGHQPLSRTDFYRLQADLRKLLGLPPRPDPGPNATDDEASDSGSDEEGGRGRRHSSRRRSSDRDRRERSHDRRRSLERSRSRRRSRSRSRDRRRSRSRGASRDRHARDRPRRRSRSRSPERRSERSHRDERPRHRDRGEGAPDKSRRSGRRSPSPARRPKQDDRERRKDRDRAGGEDRGRGVRGGESEGDREKPQEGPRDGEGGGRGEDERGSARDRGGRKREAGAAAVEPAASKRARVVTVEVDRGRGGRPAPAQEEPSPRQEAKRDAPRGRGSAGRLVSSALRDAGIRK
ncbi:unnamed protein product [Pedinophyceae sp. YPF-701]|nr:unnamed protein product [Pedinophyceae sp. YPF-701]